MDKEEVHKKTMNLLRLLTIGTLLVGSLAIASLVLAIVFTLRGPR